MSSAGASACGPCGAGRFASSLGVSACDACLAGTYSSRQGLHAPGECDGCARGSFSTGLGLTRADGCQRCPAGSTTTSAGLAACGPCGPGEFPNVLFGACATCPAFSEAGVSAGAPEQCLCAAGYRLGFNTRATGGIESYLPGSRRKTHLFLGQGGVFRLLVPTVLEVFCDGKALGSSTALPAGEYPNNNNNGNTCPATEIQYEVDAVANLSLSETYVQCVPCSAGTFSVGMMAFSQACLPCPNRTFQDQAGASSCKPCPTGSPLNEGMPTCEPCPGRTVLQAGACRPCQEGTFNPPYIQQPACLRCPINMWSLPDADDCLLCPPNSAGPGGTGLSGCVCGGGLALVDGACVACPPGTFSPPDENACLTCGNGTYNRQQGASACLSCGARAASGPGATTCTTCTLGTIPSRATGACTPCPAGFYCGLGLVFACPLGSYSLQTGLTSKSQCPPCPANHFCRTTTTIHPCPANTWSPRGSITRHFCRCNNGYKCTYFFTTTGSAVVPLTQEQLQQQGFLVAAVAQAAGVHPSKVQAVTVGNAP